MATIHNSDLIRGMAENAKLQLSRDEIPTQLSDKVVATMETNPELLRKTTIIRYASNTTTAAATMYSVPTTKDFYMTGVFVCYEKDATSDATYLYVSFYQDGELKVCADIRMLTTTASRDSVYLRFPAPIKVDRGTNINLNGVFSAGAMVKTGTLFGYEVLIGA